MSYDTKETTTKEDYEIEEKLDRILRMNENKNNEKPKLGSVRRRRL
jgi:hypothetical protein